ncbi:MAG TPA: hypothetical protein VFC67_15870 [Prolixibacteraceae bacterium]|nr:hypothetical protein [Prolixibacteraceae bacterium]
MGKHRKDEVYGTLGKTESLFVVNGKSLHGSLVFESFAPFPGYYNQQVNDLKPVYLYLGLDHEYSVFDIERANMAVKKTFKCCFEAAKGKIELFDNHFDVVRLRHLNSYDQLIPIQNEFIKSSIKLKMNTLTHVNNEKGFIHLSKIFNIRKLGKGIYIDTSEDFHAYLLFPHRLNQKEFDDTTLKVKYNWKSTGFDAASGCLFIRGKLKEMVRIYSKNLSIEYLEELRKLYLSKM